ncbi:MAG: heparan-alpha-glucosaminide N-acetyltransferase domain-containing protein [Myxococcota bacterium]
MVATRSPEPPAGIAPPIEGEASVLKPKGRAYFVDILRLIASFQMVNGHTLDAVLLPSARGGPYWGDYIWFRGMVSVSFMFVAGFAFHLATLARFEKHRASPEEVRKRFRRGVDIILIGYLLRVPYDYLHRWSEVPSTLVDQLLRCNVLQCIGVTLIVLEALTIWLKKPEHVAYAASALAALAIIAAPITDAWVPAGPAHVLLAYLSHQAGSLFPVIPWSTFMLAGCAIGFWAMPASSATPWRTTLVRLLAVAAGLWVFGEILEASPWTLTTTATHSNSRPRFIVERLTAIVLAIAVLCLVASPIRRFPSFLRTLSSETLFLYVFHLVVIFSLPFGVARLIGKTLPLHQAVWVSLFMLIFTAAAGLGWSRLKRWRKERREALA